MPWAGATAHSGAGRIGRLRMRPMTLEERRVGEPAVSLTHLLEGGREQLHGQTDVGLSRYVEEILASGFPALRSLSGRVRRFQLDSCLRNPVDRDVPEQGLAVRRPDALMAWLRAYAAATSSTAGYSQILDAATLGQGDKPARSTSDAYRRVLESLWLLDPVPLELGGSQFTRLGRSPKRHLADPALAACLLALNEAKLLGTGGGPVGPKGGPCSEVCSSRWRHCASASRRKLLRPTSGTSVLATATTRSIWSSFVKTVTSWRSRSRLPVQPTTATPSTFNGCAGRLGNG